MNSENPDLLLFDIEGTTTPISFVHEILFPYSSSQFSNYLEKNPIPKDVFEKLVSEYDTDVKSNLYSEESISESSQQFPKVHKDLFSESEVSSITKYLKFLVSVDRKSNPLKFLQGKIWEIGYQKGELKSIVYPDVKSCFERAKTKNIPIFIYSSGSVQAQISIFRYSELGDLTPYINGYFDTAIGGKREAQSYLEILKSLAKKPERPCFFTDVVEEGFAASEAGFRVNILRRPGNKEVISNRFAMLNDFSSVILDS